MSDTNSFIEEVTEEVRRDRLFSLYRRYGWIGAVLVIIIVAGAGLYEYRNAQTRAQTQAAGDALNTALQIETPQARAEALATIDNSVPLLARLHQADALLEAEEREQAIAVLDAIATDPTVDQIYSDLAKIKVLLLRGKAVPPQERIDAYQALSAPGRAFRLVALEQEALARIDAGQKEESIAALLALLDEPNISDSMRRRVERAFIILGGRLPENG